ncbi:Arc family DNA-binding protein [Antarctobacter sp.]|uniref:Arc family DNA-binding protein n=1 Tax=Antarctobacter sp. TaxID=1872577 RepID=UPI002B26E389|nr:Arc family DNA-binding protein [Antarctobacter sp.]
MREPANIPFKINMPASLRGRLGVAAETNGRSVTAEIIARLEKSFAEDDEYQNALENLDDALVRIEKLEEMVRSHDRHLNPDSYIKEW